jgi:hypothetical protein
LAIERHEELDSFDFGVVCGEGFSSVDVFVGEVFDGVAGRISQREKILRDLYL